MLGAAAPMAGAPPETDGRNSGVVRAAVGGGCAAHDRVHILLKSRMVHRVQSDCHPGQHVNCFVFNSCLRFIGKGYDHICMVQFATYRSAILAVERHVKDTGTKLLRHLSL